MEPSAHQKTSSRSNGAPHAAQEEPGLIAPDLGAICRAMPGRHRRIVTHCAPLDALTGGGLQTGRLVVIGGPPGVVKTGWALSMAHDMARGGTLVVLIAADEPRAGLLSRLGQMYGISREALDHDDLSISRPAWNLVAERVGEIPLLVVFELGVDPRADGVEQVGAWARRRAHEMGVPLVIIVDSIQVATFACDVAADHGAREKSLRERMEDRIQALKAMREGACVIAISELNRGAYRQGAEADLASFKESSAIEYGADLPMTLRRIDADGDLVIEVTPQKNRLGGLEPFRLRRTSRCTFEGVKMMPAASVGERAEAKHAVREARVAKIGDALALALVGSSKPVIGQRALLRLVRGATEEKKDAIAALKSDGRLVGGGRDPYRIVGAAEVET